jgi:hypothetical protein
VSDKPPTGSKLGSLSIAKTAGINAALSQLGIERVEGLTPYVKLAASRLDKEIRKGKLKYRDLDPGIPEGELPGFLIPAAKQRQRKALMAPSAADAETLARRRALNDALFNAQIKATAKDLGLPKVVINENLIPGSAPATTRGDVTQVHVGPTASRFLRPVVENPVRASFGIAPNLAPEAAVDSTLNKAILHHELGEARTVGQPVLTPHATHLGIDPILLENIHSQGDPEAQDFFKKLRQMHPDDALVSKLVKQVGGTPDSPIPLDSRRAKALRNALLANTNQLSKGTRARLVMEGIATPSKLPQVPETIRNIPETVVAALTNIGNRAESDDLRGAFRELYGVYPSLRDSAKYVIQGLAPNELSSLREIISRGIAQVPVAHPEQVTHPLRDALRAV